MRQRDGVAVFIAEDAARVSDVGHGQLLIRQQGHQTGRTWKRWRDGGSEGPAGRWDGAHGGAGKAERLQIGKL